MLGAMVETATYVLHTHLPTKVASYAFDRVLMGLPRPEVIVMTVAKGIEIAVAPDRLIEVRDPLGETGRRIPIPPVATTASASAKIDTPAAIAGEWATETWIEIEDLHAVMLGGMTTSLRGETETCSTTDWVAADETEETVTEAMGETGREVAVRHPRGGSPLPI